ncbi:MAG: hypothetical protein LBG42_09450 [Treponema sp.]|jgi:hypothetical protein|nr:hypothetical protein [Treponema sp.]
MAAYLETLGLVIAGVILLWFGYTLFFRMGGGRTVSAKKRKHPGKKRPKGEALPGSPQTCPVCSARLDDGELVKSSAFPSFNGKDRLMHLRGCVYCLEGGRPRICPVCGARLKNDEILIARIFERPRRRSHVHVLGCSRCKGPKKQKG